jgi:hypothetical protein
LNNPESKPATCSALNANNVTVCGSSQCPASLPSETCVSERPGPGCATQCSPNTNSTPSTVSFGCSCVGFNTSACPSTSQCKLAYASGGVPYCIPVCPTDLCTSYCADLQSYFGLTDNEVSCDVNPYSGDGCYVTVTTPKCNKPAQAQATQDRSLSFNIGLSTYCPSGTASTLAENSQGECVYTCEPLDLGLCVGDNPLTTVCDSIYGPAPCVNDVCLPSGGSCVWSHGTTCYTEPPCIPDDSPAFYVSVCRKNETGYAFWDDTPGTLNCFTETADTCPNGRRCENGAPGVCTLNNDGNCIWQCPIAQCNCSSTPTPPSPGQLGCAVWNSLCITQANGNCSWEYSCSDPSLYYDCGPIPSSLNIPSGCNATCHPRGDGAYVWQPHCFSDTTNTLTCGPSDCIFVPPPTVSICGLAPIVPTFTKINGQFKMFC